MHWWEIACTRRFLSADRLLRDPRGVQLPDDVPSAATQPRDDLVLPHDALAHGRRAWQQRPDVRRKGKGVANPSASHDQPGGADATAHEADIDFFSSADLELARWTLQGEGGGSGSGPHASADGPSGFQVARPPPDIYEVFTCGEQMMDQLAQDFVAARAADEPVYRPEPPLSRIMIQASRFKMLYHTPSPHHQYCQSSTQPLLDHQQGFDTAYLSAPQPLTYQVVRPRTQWPQRDQRPPPPCGTSSHRPIYTIVQLRI
ncbi:hypothetical protein PIB30_039033 [Stylosanthes scabra]|uniref:Uncharacterized protein n=1 Tax=Stylosanthes scabra TaxID=79078 RepID=A0ABU6RED0_9FABA|nr:hypothetical protein [Stylosanthes scabra]